MDCWRRKEGEDRVGEVESRKEIREEKFSMARRVVVEG
jgi:hypothetical protein